MNYSKMVSLNVYSSRLFHAIALVLVICFHIAPQAESIGEDAVLDFLEQLRVRMCHPIPQLGLPALDPFQITQVEAQMNNKYIIDFTGSMTDFKLTGLSDFILNDFRISMIRKSIFNVTLPLTALNSIYTAKGSLAYIANLAGDGDAEAYVKDFSLGISFSFKTGKYLGIRNLSIQIKVGEVYIDFENLLEEERINDFFHSLINELGLELLGDLWTDEQGFVEQNVQERVNVFIGQYTLSDIMKIIGSEGGESIFINGPPGDCKDVTTSNETFGTTANTYKKNTTLKQ
ncbi:uncharacterized protein LOC129253125 [Anastrepha obliqua]|uniref:uncharacterized protein LOC129253125 n=1 Tax=Anastrepha obliqua TaxID=95512 RepID=UPI002409F793|nr:uncharacterized protein LOC129253125 [Anastrepha obliqua]